jgi:hypothetical protein
MRLPNLLTRPPTPHPTTLAQLVEEPFPTSDQVLLCSFGGDLAGERTTQQLRNCLLAAGFAARVTRHLIRISPLLRRSSKGRYQLQPLERCQANDLARQGRMHCGKEGEGVAGHDTEATGPV